MENYQPKIRFTKIRDVKSPSFACANDAGSDFYMPNKTDEYMACLITRNKTIKNKALPSFVIAIEKDGKEKIQIIVPPHSQVLIPSGIKVDILDKNTYLDVNNKSGVATKKHLIVGAHVVDAGYQGEVEFNLYNISDETVTINSGEKIVQMIHKPKINTVWEEISNEEYDQIPSSDRGGGGFGSTGTK